MELFPAQPDLSLQISPPNTNKPSSSWRSRTSSSSSSQEDVDLEFWNNKSTPKHHLHHLHPHSCFDLSLSNLTQINHHQYPNVSPSPTPNHHHHHLLHHHHRYPVLDSPAHLFETLNKTHNRPSAIFHHNTPPPSSSLDPTPPSFPGQINGQDLGFLRPIRGIPVYHQTNNPSVGTGNGGVVTPSAASHGQIMMRSRFLSRFPAKRSMRAPRMRWTSTLHARFVHAVELLGGHESISPKFSLFFFIFFFFTFLGFIQNLSYGKFNPLFILYTIRSDAEVGSRAHGCQRSNLSSCEISFTGTA